MKPFVYWALFFVLAAFALANLAYGITGHAVNLAVGVFDVVALAAFWTVRPSQA